MLIEYHFILSLGCLWQNSSAQIPELQISWCSMSQTVQTNVKLNNGDFPLRTAINRSHSSLHTLAVCYIVNWQQFTKIWYYLNPIAWCFLVLLLPVLRTESLNVHPGSYFWCLYWQHHDELRGVYACVGCQWVKNWMKRPFIGLIQISGYLDEEFVQPWFGGVE